MLSIADGNMTNNCEDDTTGEPDALKGARPVRKGIERKGLATIPRSQSTLHHASITVQKQSSYFSESP